jgi:hypothetical protein
MHRMQHEQSSGAATHGRARHRPVTALAAVAAGAVATLAVLLGFAWLMLPGPQPPRPVRVATPSPGPVDALTPPKPETRRGGSGTAVVPPGETRAPREAPTTVGERPGPPAPAPKLEKATREPVGPMPEAAETAPSQSARTEPESTPSPPSARTAPGDQEMAAHVEAERLAGGLTRYTVRLYERDGRPVTGATVSIRGRGADGASEEAMLDAEPEAGVYQAVIRFTVTEARLRVAGVGRVQEIPLPDLPS